MGIQVRIGYAKPRDEIKGRELLAGIGCVGIHKTPKKLSVVGTHTRVRDPNSTAATRLLEVLAVDMKNIDPNGNRFWVDDVWA